MVNTVQHFLMSEVIMPGLIWETARDFVEVDSCLQLLTLSETPGRTSNKKQE